MPPSLPPRYRGRLRRFRAMLGTLETLKGATKLCRSLQLDLDFGQRGDGRARGSSGRASRVLLQAQWTRTGTLQGSLSKRCPVDLSGPLKPGLAGSGCPTGVTGSASRRRLFEALTMTVIMIICTIRLLVIVTVRAIILAIMMTPVTGRLQRQQRQTPSGFQCLENARVFAPTCSQSNQTINQLINQPTNQSINQSVNQSISHSIVR